MRPRFPALASFPASPAFMTHSELVRIAEANRQFEAIDAAHQRVESIVRRGAPTDVQIERMSLELC